MEQRDISKNEHTQNIRAGLAVLKTMYSMHIDEYDYIDLAVDLLRDIKHFGTTEYVTYVTVNAEGKANLPCNVNTIDAVTTEHMGRKAYATRVLVETDGILHTDQYYLEERIQNGLRNNIWRPGLGGLTGPGYISYQLECRHITVSKEFVDQRIAIAFTGIATDPEGYPLITRKQANALAAVAAKTLCIRGANRGDKALASMIQFYTPLAARLIQAASIPENFSDNELDEVLNCMTTFNKKSVSRPSKYSR
jgi:hypothetical protein